MNTQDRPTSVPKTDTELNLLSTPVQALLRKAPVTLPPTTSIKEAAQLMTAQRISSILIVQNEALIGIMTDRDLRSRVVAAGLDTQRPITDVATLDPISIDVKQLGFDALLLMARHNIHHLPVLDGTQVAGMLTATNLTEHHSMSPVYLAGDIHKQSTLPELQRVCAQIPQLQHHLAAAQTSAYSTGHMVTAVADALTSRLLHLAHAQLGPAPVDFAWVAAGSQARNEQSAKSDQDNCLVLADDYDPKKHQDYFKALTELVCHGLDACGYIYCPGDMMAQNSSWRMSHTAWRQQFQQWVHQPDPTALMLTCVFFDMRAIAGQTQLLDQLRQDVLQTTRGNRLFLAHMVKIALSRKPPLSLFKRLITQRTGEHKGCLDLKMHGIVPVVDLARVYALSAGSIAVNTHDRLLDAASGGEISEQNAHDLRDALEFLAYTRIQHQARQLNNNLPVDNFLNPSELSNFERTQLKDAFMVVHSLQDVLSHRYSF